MNKIKQAYLQLAQDSKDKVLTLLSSLCDELLFLRSYKLGELDPEHYTEHAEKQELDSRGKITAIQASLSAVITPFMELPMEYSVARGLLNELVEAKEENPNLKYKSLIEEWRKNNPRFKDYKFYDIKVDDEGKLNTAVGLQVIDGEESGNTYKFDFKDKTVEPILVGSKKASLHKKATSAEEIAESFVNGNISWVREHVQSIKKYQQVLDVMKEMFPNEVESFERVIGRYASLNKKAFHSLQLEHEIDRVKNMDDKHMTINQLGDGMWALDVGDLSFQYENEDDAKSDKEKLTKMFRQWLFQDASLNKKAGTELWQTPEGEWWLLGTVVMKQIGPMSKSKEEVVNWGIEFGRFSSEIKERLMKQDPDGVSNPKDVAPQNVMVVKPASKEELKKGDKVIVINFESPNQDMTEIMEKKTPGTVQYVNGDWVGVTWGGGLETAIKSKDLRKVASVLDYGKEVINAINPYSPYEDGDEWVVTYSTVTGRGETPKHNEKSFKSKADADKFIAELKERVQQESKEIEKKEGSLKDFYMDYAGIKKNYPDMTDFMIDMNVNIAENLQDLDNKVMDAIVANSGGELKADPEMLQKYYDGIKAETKQYKFLLPLVYDLLENVNYHTLNEALSLLGMYGDKGYVGKDMKDVKVSKVEDNITKNVTFGGDVASFLPKQYWDSPESASEKEIEKAFKKAETDLNEAKYDLVSMLELILGKQNSYRIEISNVKFEEFDSSNITHASAHYTADISGPESLVKKFAQGCESSLKQAGFSTVVVSVDKLTDAMKNGYRIESGTKEKYLDADFDVSTVLNEIKEVEYSDDKSDKYDLYIVRLTGDDWFEVEIDKKGATAMKQEKDASEKNRVCPKCGKPVQKETDEELKKKYPWVCSECDENFFDFETKESSVKQAEELTERIPVTDEDINEMKEKELEEMTLEELASYRLKLQSWFEDFQVSLNKMEDDLREKHNAAVNIKAIQDVEPYLVDAIKKINDWKYRVDGWKFQLNKAGRVSFKYKEFMKNFEKLLTEKAPELMKDWKDMEYAATKAPDPDDLKLDLERELEKTVEKELHKRRSSLIQNLWNKFENWLKETFFAQADKVDALMDSIDKDMNLMFAEASMVKTEALVENSEYDFSKGGWELIETDGVKEFVFKGDLKTRIENALKNKQASIVIRMSQPVLIDFNDRIVEGKLTKVVDRKKCTVIVNGSQVIEVPLTAVTPLFV